MAEQSSQPHTIGSSLAHAASSRTLTTPAQDIQRKQTVALLLTRLAIHYYRPDFTEQHARLLIEDMVNDLEGLSVYDVEQGIKAYRTNPKNRFFPTSGQLRELCVTAARERAAAAQPKRKALYDGESRPILWWLQRRSLWRPHWQESDIPEHERVRYYDWKRAGHGA